MKYTNSNKVGVAQVLNRLNYVSSLSHVKRISTPLDKNGKLIPPRKLHNTSWGFICPAETPEGQSVGVVKNLSYMTHISIPSNVTPLYDIVLPHIYPMTAAVGGLHTKTKVFVNGAWVGVVDSPMELYLFLKDKKYKGMINIYTSIIFDTKMNELRICNDSGRLMRPLLRVVDNHLLLTHSILRQLKKGALGWNDLLNASVLNQSILEYIDPEEQSWSLIAMYPSMLKPTDVTTNLNKYTHCEIHPSTIFGILPITNIAIFIIK